MNHASAYNGFQNVHKEIGYTIADILIIMQGSLSGTDGAGTEYLLYKLPVGFVKTYHRAFINL
jgi:hypothetical protein